MAACGTNPARAELTDALCARLCHDLSSPLGTLIGSLELMMEDPGSIAEALPLASEVALAMGARLRLLRAAWTGDAGPMTRSQLAGLAKGLPGRVQADLTGLQDGAFPSPMARVLLNLLLLGAEALPKGGVVAMTGQPDADVLVMLDGPSAAWPAELPLALADLAAVPLNDPRTVQPSLVAMSAQAAGLRLTILMAPGAPVAAAPLLLAPG